MAEPQTSVRHALERSKADAGGIWTPGGLSPTTVFKTVALDHSATHPYIRHTNWDPGSFYHADGSLSKPRFAFRLGLGYKTFPRLLLLRCNAGDVPRKCNRLDNGQVRIPRAKAIVFHQIEKIVVSGNQIRRTRGNRQVDIRLVLRIARQRDGPRNARDQEKSPANSIDLTNDSIHSRVSPGNLRRVSGRVNTSAISARISALILRFAFPSSTTRRHAPAGPSGRAAPCRNTMQSKTASGVI